MESIELDSTIAIGSGETRWNAKRPHASHISGQTSTPTLADGVPVYVPFENVQDPNEFMRVNTGSDGTTPYVQLTKKGVYYIHGSAQIGGIDSTANFRHVTFLITGPNMIEATMCSGNAETICTPSNRNLILPWASFAVVEDDVFDDNKVYALMMARGTISPSGTGFAYCRFIFNYLGLADQRLLYG